MLSAGPSSPRLPLEIWTPRLHVVPVPPSSGGCIKAPPGLLAAHQAQPMESTSRKSDGWRWIRSVSLLSPSLPTPQFPLLEATTPTEKPSPMSITPIAPSLLRIRLLPPSDLRVDSLHHCHEPGCFTIPCRFPLTVSIPI